MNDCGSNQEFSPTERGGRTYPETRNALTKQSAGGGGEERRKEFGTAEGTARSCQTFFVGFVFVGFVLIGFLGQPEKFAGCGPLQLAHLAGALADLVQSEAWEDNLSTLNAEDNSLWGIAKAFRKKTSPISALHGPTGIALSDTNKTEVITHSLENQFQLNDIHNSHKDVVITSVVDAYLDSNINNTGTIPPTLPSEIIQIIKKIKIKKCPGRDGITNKMIKKLPKLNIFKITNIVNNMLTLRYFPKSWKTAVVVPILKPGKNSALAESYRPISLLPVLSKLAEKVILARLNDHLERENILIPEQHGFQPRLSTSHQLLRVVEFIKEGNETKMNARPRSSLIFKKPSIESGILAYSLN
ncbi:RNA-directed DNA polymerase from mobile element jockey [Trichonephila clavipes]|nr:RNA-directed DNA polymerase from mobile element jockey [Trichonephila clavipes]